MNRLASVPLRPNCIAGYTVHESAIRTSLEADNAEEDFWWLNNGVTIIAKKASISGETISLKEPQIVNGLQTSYEIYRFFSQKNGKLLDNRNVLVRVIVTKEESSTFKIIKANNSQTKVPDASLRATDEVHRDIEDTLLKDNLFYERRKNFYKNKKKPINNIISITYMAQVITSICLQEPNNARARPANLLKDEKEYIRIFSNQNNLLAYLNACKIQRLVEDTLRSSTIVAKSDINNIKYHVSMTSSCRATNKINPDFNAIAKINFALFDTKLIDQDIDLVYKLYINKGGNDTVAKSTDFVTTLKTSILTTVLTSKRSASSSKSTKPYKKKSA